MCREEDNRTVHKFLLEIIFPTAADSTKTTNTLQIKFIENDIFKNVF